MPLPFSAARRPTSHGRRAWMYFHSAPQKTVRSRRKRSFSSIPMMRAISNTGESARAISRRKCGSYLPNSFVRSKRTAGSHGPRAPMRWRARWRKACTELLAWRSPYPVQANAVFARLPEEMIRRLRAHGAGFYDWAEPSGGRTLVRLVTSFATPEMEIERLLQIAQR